MGSVKDLSVITEADKNKPGRGIFKFSDRYSVFDWGEMPNYITNKGKSLSMIGAWFFEEMEKMGIKTHYVGMIENGETKRINELEHPSDEMEVELLRVIKPNIVDNRYDYSKYEEEIGCFLIPLEVIYRNYLPENSSVFNRLKKGELTLENLGLKEMPQPGQKLEKPIIDVSTKLERSDRYISWDEAKNIVNLSSIEVENIKKITMMVNKFISECARDMGLINEDGKLEFGFDENRNLVIVDVFGTPDECRFKFKDIPVSKEIARIFYRRTDWYKEVVAAKQSDTLNWKNLVKNSPPKLSDNLNRLISEVYQSFCNKLTGKRWFDVPELKEILFNIKEELG